MSRGRYTAEGRARKRAAYWQRIASRLAAARVARGIVSGIARPYAMRESP